MEAGTANAGNARSTQGKADARTTMVKDIRIVKKVSLEKRSEESLISIRVILPGPFVEGT
jgi:hypothetical protein